MGKRGEMEKNGEVAGTAHGMWVVEGCGGMWVRKTGEEGKKNGTTYPFFTVPFSGGRRSPPTIPFVKQPTALTDGKIGTLRGLGIRICAATSRPTGLSRRLAGIRRWLGDRRDFEAPSAHRKTLNIDISRRRGIGRGMGMGGGGGGKHTWKQWHRLLRCAPLP